MDYLVKRPMLLCGVILSTVTVTGFYSKTLLFIIGVLTIILMFILFYKRLHVYVVVLLFVLLTVFSSFWQLSQIEETKYFDGALNKGEYIVISEPVMKDDYYVVTLEVHKSEMLKKGTKISVIGSEPGVSFSDKIIADVTLQALQDSPFKLIDYSEKIYYNGYMKNVENTGEKDFVLSKVSNLREYIKSKIFKNYDFSEAATVTALITSNKDYFTDRFYSNVKGAGVAHVMVVSGMHLSIVVTFLLFFTRKFLYNRYLKALITFISVLTVVTVCGFTMSIIRAGITYILISVSLILGRPNTPSNTLGAAVSLILINNPLAVFNVVFQLSVLSTFGILVVAAPIIEFIKEKEYIKNKILFDIFSAVIITLSATLLTLPAMIYHFEYVSNVFIVTNLLVCIPATFAMCFAILGLIMPPLEKVLFFLSETIVKYINAVINYFGSLSFSTTRVERSTVYIAITAIIIVLLILLACKNYINVLKLNEINEKRKQEGGERFKWQSFMKKR